MDSNLSDFEKFLVKRCGTGNGNALDIGKLEYLTRTLDNHLHRDRKATSRAETVDGLKKAILKQLTNATVAEKNQIQIGQSFKYKFDDKSGKFAFDGVDNGSDGNTATQADPAPAASATHADAAASASPAPAQAEKGVMGKVTSAVLGFLGTSRVDEKKHVDPHAGVTSVKLDDVDLDLENPARALPAVKKPRGTRVKSTTNDVKTTLEKTGTNIRNVRNAKKAFTGNGGADNVDLVELMDKVERSTKNKAKPKILQAHETQVKTSLKTNKEKVGTALNKPDKFDEAFDKKMNSTTKNISSKLDKIYKRKKFFE